MSTTDPVVVRFRFRGGDYRLEVDPAIAQRLSDAEDTFTPEPEAVPRRRPTTRWGRSQH